MLVKIIAAGLTQSTWRKGLAQLRAALPEQPFSVGMFTGKEELAYLTDSFFPRQFEREAPDFLLCPAPPQQNWASLLPFVQRVQALAKRPALVLAFNGLERTLKQQISAHGSLGLMLDSGNLCILSDPEFLAADFPADFPRIKVDGSLTALRYKNQAEDVPPHTLADGTLVGFSQLEAIVGRGELISPKGWLKSVLTEAGAGRAPRPAGLLKESGGLFLFPAVPLAHVCGITIAGVHFSYLLDMDQLHTGVPQFAAFAEAVNEAGHRHLRTWKSHTRKIRQAEAKCDIPIVCAGPTELLRESLAALLVREGHHRCFTLATPMEGVLREPALLIQVASWEQGELGAQTIEPLVMDIGGELEACMKPLDGMLSWRELKYEPPPVDIPPLTREQFTQQHKRLSARATRVRKKFELEQKRALLMDQEVRILRTAQEKFAQLLDVGDTVQVWTGEALAVNQMLLFSYDEEEAATVMRALPHIPKKRWFDLAPFASADSMQNLDLDKVRHYGEDGAMRFTPSARDRLEEQRQSGTAQLEQAQEELNDSEAQLNSLRGDLQDIASAQEKLARHWVWHSLGTWLKDSRPHMGKAFSVLRAKQETLWFNRSHVRRALILPGRQENGAAMLEACEKVYPSFSRNTSIIVPYEFDPLDALPEEEAGRIREEGKAEGLAGGGISKRLAQALAERNEAQFADFLQLVSSELTGVRTDLVLIEHHPEIAPRILDHLRRAAPRLEDVPAVLILSDVWSPPANKPLPWARTRIALLPRMGALTAEDCTEHLLALYSN